MMSSGQSQTYIIEENKRLQLENRELKEKNSDYEQELEACGNDEKTISNLRALLHNLNSIKELLTEKDKLSENFRNTVVSYINDTETSFSLYRDVFIILLLGSCFFSFNCIYAIVFQCGVGIYIDQINNIKFKKSIEEISRKIYDKNKICEKESKNMEIFDQLIDSV